MDNTLVVCGGTGAHTALAFLRLHTLGYALGFFDRGGRRLDFPTTYLVDQDAGDGAESFPTAWQLTRQLVELHPGRRNWTKTINRAQAPELVTLTPLPLGADEKWYRRPYNTLARRFEGAPHRDALVSPHQQSIDYSKGMMGSPAIGSLLFELKEHDRNEARLNHDRTYGRLLDTRGRIVVTGSGVGGTGASIAPTLAQRLAVGSDDREGGEVMAVLLLEWFRFDQQYGDTEISGRAQRRNRRMRENANSALDFYGQNLSQTVATLPVGLPKENLLLRRFTGDVAQPVAESFVHLVAALAAYRHFLVDHAYPAGLYIMGAVKPGRLDGATAIPGGTLQGLANQAATLADLLEVWRRTLVQAHQGRVTPAIYQAVKSVCDQPAQVADRIEREAAHYREQLAWLEQVMGIESRLHPSFSRESRSRKRLGEGRKGLPVRPGSSPEEVASALFHWTAEWVREEASTANHLVCEAAPVGGGHWPDLQDPDSISVSANRNGDLTRIEDGNRDAVLKAFVDRSAVSVNAWPHPLAAADFFREAIRQEDPRALRQLELLLVGVVSGELELRRLESGLGDPAGVTLEALLAEHRREGWPAVAELAVVLRVHDGERTIAFTSPHTVFAPVPAIGPEEADEVWGPLWQQLSGTSDGSHWATAKEPVSWGQVNEQIILLVLSWIAHLRHIHTSQAPPWTQVFKTHRGAEEGIPFGTGTQLRVFWGAAGERVAEVHLPTTDFRVWEPPPGVKPLDETVLFENVPDLRELRGSDGQILYKMVELRVPDREGTLRAWWSEHLDLLKRQGKIHIWARDPQGAVVIGMVDVDGLKAATLGESRLLDRRDVSVRTTVPFQQDPVPGSTRAVSLVWPDLPIHSDYFDLVQTGDGSHLHAELAAGRSVDISQWRPTVRRDEAGRLAASWRLQLRGRSEPMPIEMRVDPPGAEQAHEWAHWMVWPRFRSVDGSGWRTYYVYERSSIARLRADTLWLDRDREQSRLARTRASERDVPMYPVRYDVDGQQPAHVGGPPLALVQRDRTNAEQGLFLVPLEVLPAGDIDVEVAVDFGTSHSVAAARIGQERPQPVRLGPELGEGASPLSVHVSEAWSHVRDERGGLMAAGAWLPTYTNGRTETTGVLASDLLFRESVKPIHARDIERWIAGEDYRIPPFHIARSDQSTVLITDFKWEAGVPGFNGKEPVLQQHYLSMFLELVLAEVIGQRCRQLPNRLISFTFTYPLRNRRDQVKRYEDTIRKVLARLSEGSGLDLQLKDGIGIYDESRAARLAGLRFGEVIQVADLGGGTLDLFLSAYEKVGVRFPQVTDSVRLGGNFLLRQIAESGGGMLPVDGNWGSHDARDIEIKLRAWMRTIGAPELFGMESRGGRAALESMGISGFKRPADADRARHLLDRYFRLIAEYMARNLAAFLFHHWYPQVAPQDHANLSISVQLRGNGWRMRYQRESYIQATAAIQELVRERVLALWKGISGNRYPAPAAARHWAPAADYEIADPKLEPILSVVGKSQAYEEVESNFHSHTPVDVLVQHRQGQLAVSWGAPIPFDTHDSKQVEVAQLSPPVPLSRSSAAESVVLRELDASRQNRINGTLQNEGLIDPGTGKYRAPLGAVVWETIFDTKAYWPES